MTDPYRIADTSSVPTTPQRQATGLLRPALWLALILSAAANAVTSLMNLHPVISAGFGLIALSCVTALTLHHYRARRQG